MHDGGPRVRNQREHRHETGFASGFVSSHPYSQNLKRSRPWCDGLPKTGSHEFRQMFPRPSRVIGDDSIVSHVPKTNRWAFRSDLHSSFPRRSNPTRGEDRPVLSVARSPSRLVPAAIVLSLHESAKPGSMSFPCFVANGLPTRSTGPPTFPAHGYSSHLDAALVRSGSRNQKGRC